MNGDLPKPAPIDWGLALDDIPEQWVSPVAQRAAMPQLAPLPNRPTTFAEVLDGIAAWIDQTDQILVRRGEKKTLSDGMVQADLRRIARSLREDPDLDDLMMDSMLHGPDLEDS